MPAPTDRACACQRHDSCSVRHAGPRPLAASTTTMYALLLTSLLSSACATTVAHAGEPAALTPDVAKDASSPPSAGPRLGAIRDRTRIGDDTRIALPGDHELRLHRDGAVWLDDTTQLAYGGDTFVASYYEVFVGDVETTLFIGKQLANVPGDSGIVQALRFDARTGRTLWHGVMQTEMDLDEPPGTHHPWRVLDARSRFVVVEPGRISAIDAATGDDAWTFGALESSFPATVHDESTQPFRKVEIDDAVVDGDTVVVTARAAGVGDFESIELELASGNRMWRRSNPASPPILALADLHTVQMQFEPRLDSPPEPRITPIVVEGHDLRVVGHALLLWNLRTAKGVIINPTQSAREAILEQARTLRVRDADGRERAITWTGVIDTRALALAFVKRRGVATGTAPALRFSYSAGLGLRWTGAQLDFDAVASALGTKVVRTRADVNGGALGFTVDHVEGVHPSVRVRFGKIDVIDDIGWPDTGPMQAM